MNMELDRIGQASNLALVRACRRLNRSGCVGEATRAWSLADSWRRHAALLITHNAESLQKAPARQVVRELSTVLAKHILQAELKSK